MCTVQGMPGVIDCPQAVAAAPTGEEPCQGCLDEVDEFDPVLLYTGALSNNTSALVCKFVPISVILKSELLWSFFPLAK